MEQGTDDWQLLASGAVEPLWAQDSSGVVGHAGAVIPRGRQTIAIAV